MPDFEAAQQLRIMKNIVNSLQQVESNNISLARRLSNREIANAADLNQNIGTVPQMAQNESQAASLLNQLVNAETNTVQQLQKLEQMLTDLENRLS